MYKQHATTIIAYTYQGEAFHPECWEQVYVPDEDLDNAAPVFADSEWDYVPTCGVCHEPIEEVRLIEEEN